MHSAAPPPTSTRRWAGLAVLGPGLLVAATGVGAGDLATAAFTGHAAGLGILWAVVVGAAVKFVLNEGIARWQLHTGESLLAGVLTRTHPAVRWLFLGYFVLWSFLVGAALLSACGAAALAILPLTGDPDTDKILYGIGHSLVAWALVRRGGYRLFERTMGAAIALMLVTVVACAVRLAPDPAALVSGLLVPSLPTDPDALRWTLALLGGVGGTVTLLAYGYWIREEGRHDASSLRLCRLDLAVGYSVTALFGIAMVVLGTTVEVSGRGVGLIVQLARSLDGALGPGLGPIARVAFLAGAWAAIASSTLGVWQSAPYLFADTVRARPGGKVSNEPPPQGTDDPLYRRYLLAIALVPMLGLGVGFARMQKLYAITGAAFMPALAVALLWANRDRFVGAGRNHPATQVTLGLILGFFGWMFWRALG